MVEALVFHAHNLLDGMMKGVSDLASDAGSVGDSHAIAAKVRVDDINDVFRVTNAIDAPWTRNPEVLAVLTDRPRSTSVGDVYLARADGEEPCFWRVATMGLEQGSPAQAEAFLAFARSAGAEV